MINNIACEVSLDLEQTIEIRGEGGQPIDAKTVLFKKPTRSSGPIFQKISSMVNRAMVEGISLVESLADQDELKKAKEKLEQEQKNRVEEDAIVAIENITQEQLDKEVEGMLAMFNTMDIDFEKLQILFDRMLLNGTRSSICFVGGMPLTDSMLDKIDYQDGLKMMATYISFFGKPAKSGTKKGSEMQSGSATQATEV